MSNLLLAEDTRDLNRAVTAVLEHSGYEVDSVEDGEQALQHLMEKVYDVVILDIMMPVLDGISVLKEMRMRNILTPVLLLTARAEVDDRVEGLDAGADDYLTKPFAMKELLARVRSLSRRQEDYSIRNLSFGDVELCADSFELSARNTVRLSIKEFELMQTLMMNCGHTLETKYLLKHVWRNETGATEEAVLLYISYLRGKLRAVNASVTIDGDQNDGFHLSEITKEET